jgi:alginate O-acetyltransferase complex protein AlgI
MVFSTSVFLAFFLPVVLLLYFIIPDQFKNVYLLIVSIFFYSWGAPRFIFVILGTTTVDFYLVRMMAATTTEARRKLFLLMSLSLNLGLLVYFKYFNFFVSNINEALTFMGYREIPWIRTVLPIGISFYTFETVTYVMDVYRKQHKPLSNFIQYQVYILLFPKLIAGPIMRFCEISDQITDRFSKMNSDMILNGFFTFTVGLGKKVLIANVMAKVADDVFASSAVLGTADHWIGIMAYTFQIYFDFSGYSDMAIGIGKMLGFRLTENFNNPYTSRSVTEFWRRWHITLGNWMRNYLYIPLGGSKVDSQRRLYFNLWIVFVLSGFWHGADWTFIFWGIYFGIWLVLERMFLKKYLEKLGVFSWLWTFFIAVIGWVLFRAESLSQASHFLVQLFSLDAEPHNRIFIDDQVKWLFAVAAVFSFFVLFPVGQRIQNYFYHKEDKSILGHSVTVVIGLFLFVISLSAVTSSGFNPFIYFRF